MAKPDVFSVPRRFDLATLLVAMAGFAALFGGLLMINAPPWTLAFLGGLFAMVAAAQWLAAKRNCPRLASVVAGVLVFWVAAIAGIPPHLSWAQFLAIQLIPATMTGSVYGYVAGTLVGGIFLGAHYLREWLGRGEQAATPESAQSESPWDADNPDDNKLG